MLGMMLVFVMGGCIKEPTREISDAQSAVEAAIQAGACIYTANEIKSLGDQLTAAIDLAKSQTGKFLASNKKAKEKLIKIKTDADALKTTILAKKTEAKNNAMIGLADTQAALKEAQNLLANPLKDLGTKSDIEAITANITALEDSLP